MDLVQGRIVTGDAERLAAFCARLVRVSVVPNHCYAEVRAEAGPAGFSRRRLAMYREDRAVRPSSPQHQAEIIGFRAGDMDAECKRISHLGVTWVMPPATQLPGRRTMPSGTRQEASSTSPSPAEATPG